MGLTSFRAMISAMVSASLVKVPSGGNVETVLTPATQRGFPGLSDPGHRSILRNGSGEGDLTVDTVMPLEATTMPVQGSAEPAPIGCDARHSELGWRPL